MCNHKLEILEWDFPHKIVTWCEECRMKSVYSDLSVDGCEVTHYPTQPVEFVTIDFKLKKD